MYHGKLSMLLIPWVSPTTSAGLDMSISNYLCVLWVYPLYPDDFRKPREVVAYLPLTLIIDLF